MRLSYLLADLLGTGSYGRVFAAKITGPGHNKSAGKDVALKKTRITNHVRHPVLLHEAYALVLVRGHPNIPRVLAWGRSQYFEYLAMERLGPDLVDVVQEVGLTQRNAVALICQMLDALEHVHEKGLVHCDIKPSNIVIGRGDNAGRVYLIDFGLAFPWSLDRQPGGARGTAHYASLRVLGGKAPLPRDDLESLAYTVVHLLTGSLPWVSWTSKERLDRGAVNGRELCQGYPDVFAQFVDFACSLSPTDELRYQHWRQAFRRLERGLPEHPMFNKGDTCTRAVLVETIDSNGDKEDNRYTLEQDQTLFGGESRSATGGIHGFRGFRGSSWDFPTIISPCYRMSGEFDFVSRNLEFIDEPPVYNGGRSVQEVSPLETMNNTQSDTHCIRI